MIMIVIMIIRIPVLVIQVEAGRRGPPISTIFIMHKGLSQLVTMVTLFCSLFLLFPIKDHHSFPPNNIHIHISIGVTNGVILGERGNVSLKNFFLARKVIKNNWLVPVEGDLI